MKAKADDSETYEYNVTFTTQEYEWLGELAAVLHQGPDRIVKRALFGKKGLQARVLKEEGRQHAKRVKKHRDASAAARIEP